MTFVSEDSRKKYITTMIISYVRINHLLLIRSYVVFHNIDTHSTHLQTRRCEQKNRMQNIGSISSTYC